jgi:hypothetical protein
VTSYVYVGVAYSEVSSHARERGSAESECKQFRSQASTLVDAGSPETRGAHESFRLRRAAVPSWRAHLLAVDRIAGARTRSARSVLLASYDGANTRHRPCPRGHLRPDRRPDARASGRYRIVGRPAPSARPPRLVRSGWGGDRRRHPVRRLSGGPRRGAGSGDSAASDAPVGPRGFRPPSPSRARSPRARRGPPWR